MPSYDPRDFPADIEMMVAASNWCLTPTPQAWARLITARRTALPMPADMEPVTAAIDAVGLACDGQAPRTAAAQAARARLSAAVEKAAHDRRAANGVRRKPAGGKVARPVLPRDIAEVFPEDEAGQWWQR